MFRGFDIQCGADFESVVRRIQPELSDQYRGTSPRRLIPGTTVKRTISCDTVGLLLLRDILYSLF